MNVLPAAVLIILLAVIVGVQWRRRYTASDLGQMSPQWLNEYRASDL